MTEFIQQLINGLSLGAIYALIALGYTMVYGVLRFINFAHGDVYMFGAFMGYYLAPSVMRVFGQKSICSGLVILLLAMVICAILGIVIERLVYRPLRDRPKLTVLITAIGVSLFMENAGQYVFGPDPKAFPDIINDHAIDFGPLAGWMNKVLFSAHGHSRVADHPLLQGLSDLTVTISQVLVLAVTVVLLLLLTWIVKRTKLGMAMRALSFNPVAASLMGINNDVVIAFTFGLGSALAAAAGILFAISYPSIDPLMGILPGLKAFVAAVLGGIGNIPGAALGGLIIGLVETLVVGYSDTIHIPSTYRDAVAFAILILILLFKPTGLLGKAEREKV